MEKILFCIETKMGGTLSQMEIPMPPEQFYDYQINSLLRSLVLVTNSFILTIIFYRLISTIIIFTFCHLNKTFWKNAIAKLKESNIDVKNVNRLKQNDNETKPNLNDNLVQLTLWQLFNLRHYINIALDNALTKQDNLTIVANTWRAIFYQVDACDDTQKCDLCSITCNLNKRDIALIISDQILMLVNHIICM